MGLTVAGVANLELLGFSANLPSVFPNVVYFKHSRADLISHSAGYKLGRENIGELRQLRGRQ